MLTIHVFANEKRVYVDQFPKNSEHLIMPRTVVFSLYMGKLKYSHLPLLLESMRWNTNINFVLVNVIAIGSNDADDIVKLKSSMGVENFHVEVLTITEWRALVLKRLNIDVPFTKDWFYKLCDYKPTVAHLFPDLARNDTYKYWGYADLDIIWGNISRFAHWFQPEANIPFVVSGWFGTTGAGAFYVNEDWTTRYHGSSYFHFIWSLFNLSPLYVGLN